MSEIDNIINNNCILECHVGSFLYGTYIEGVSDKDKSGIFIAPKEYYLGLNTIEEINYSHVDKLDNGKNSKDAVDFKLYELRKFMKLCMENNPNILEHLFIPKDKIIKINNVGQKILDNAHLFPWKGLKQKFLGYAFSQKHKMIIKTDNYTSLNVFDSWLDENLRNPREEMLVYPNEYFSNQLLAELRENKSLKGVVKFHEHHALVGDINISLTDKLSKVRNKVKERLSKVGNREELYTKYGFDVKFAGHLVRLMLEGKELLETGELQYPLKERQTLLDIREGKWAMDDILSYSEELEREIENLEGSSKLPSKPRFKEIETLLINIVSEFHNFK